MNSRESDAARQHLQLQQPNEIDWAETFDKLNSIEPQIIVGGLNRQCRIYRQSCWQSLIEMVGVVQPDYWAMLVLFHLMTRMQQQLRPLKH